MNKDLPQVYISVDDFGISELANTNILTLVAAKKIDRVSVMMNGILKPEEVRMLLDANIKLDIHLDRKQSIHKNRKLRGGLFGRLIEFVWSYFFGSNKPSRVRVAWHDQLRKFQEVFGKSPDGLNTHEHVHYFPPYMKVLLLLAKEYEIPFVRLGYKNTRNYTAVAFIINLLRGFNKGALRQSKVVTTERMLSFDWLSHTGPFVDFQAHLEKGTVTEVVFHPERQEEFEYMQNFL
ncbi:MAG: ChbG/HpnK family deacetylase [Candidatus Moranbacteria bacterium]|nr:ChbG/HpnK family deacetylase [Candidatus Moranbacteria bacterium]